MPVPGTVGLEPDTLPAFDPCGHLYWLRARTGELVRHYDFGNEIQGTLVRRAECESAGDRRRPDLGTRRQQDPSVRGCDTATPWNDPARVRATHVDRARRCRRHMGAGSLASRRRAAPLRCSRPQLQTRHCGEATRSGRRNRGEPARHVGRGAGRRGSGHRRRQSRGRPQSLAADHCGCRGAEGRRVVRIHNGCRQANPPADRDRRARSCARHAAGGRQPGRDIQPEGRVARPQDAAHSGRMVQDCRPRSIERHRHRGPARPGAATRAAERRRRIRNRVDVHNADAGRAGRPGEPLELCGYRGARRGRQHGGDQCCGEPGSDWRNRRVVPEPHDVAGRAVQGDRRAAALARGEDAHLSGQSRRAAA